MITVISKYRAVPIGVVGIALVAASAHTTALEQSGQVNQLEVWSNGNVAFTLNPTVSECNSWFVLNYSVPGSKNHYAAVLSAKTTGRSVRVNYSGQCGAADNFNGSAIYNIPTYIYVEQ